MSSLSLSRGTKLPTVPKTLLKRRKRNDGVRNARAFASAASNEGELLQRVLVTTHYPVSAVDSSI